MTRNLPFPVRLDTTSAFVELLAERARRTGRIERDINHLIDTGYIIDAPGTMPAGACSWVPGEIICGDCLSGFPQQLEAKRESS